MNSPKIYSVFCILVVTCLLTACGGLTRSDKPAVTTWWLKPYIDMTGPAVAQPVLPLDITVTAVPGLDSDKILTLSPDAELKPYAGARWAEHVPELLVSLLERSLQASGKFEILHGIASTGSPTCDLQLELREFFADLDSGGRTTGVRVALSGRHQCGSAAAVVVHSSVTITVADERMNIIVAAFQQATDQMTDEILNQL